MSGGRTRSLILIFSVAAFLVCGAFGIASFVRHRQPSQPLPQTDVAEVAKPQPPALGLDDDEKALIWDIEHHGNVLNKYGFKVLADNLARGDAPGVAEALAADFHGRLATKKDLQVTRDYIEAARQRNSDLASESANRDQFLAAMMAYRSRFTQPPKIEMKLMNLSPVVRKDFSAAWQGSCFMRMAGDSSGHPCEVSLQMQYEIVQPTEENLQKGGWLRSCTITQSQVVQTPHFLLRDATAERGIDARLFHDNWISSDAFKQPNTGGVYLCDFDRDGILDMLVVDVNRYVLYKGLPGGKFTDVTLQVGLPERLPGDSMLLAAFVDIDGDGWDDLILGGRVYRNEQGRHFTDYTARTNLSFRDYVSGVAVADFDRDGRLDLYVSYGAISEGSSWLEGKSVGSKGNRLFRNLGDWKFEDVTEKAGAAGGQRSSFTSLWLDANNDGWPDLYVINEFGTGVLLINQGNGTFREHLLGSGPNDFGSMGVIAGDYDNDGNIDIYVGNMYSKAGCRVIGNVCAGTYPEPIMDTMRHFVTGSQLWRNAGGLKFEPLGKDYGVAAVGWAYGPAMADLDNDGWLDIYATAGFISQSRSDPDG